MLVLCSASKVGYILFAGSTIRNSILDSYCWQNAISWLNKHGALSVDMLGANNKGTAIRKSAWGALPKNYFELLITKQ